MAPLFLRKQNIKLNLMFFTNYRRQLSYLKKFVSPSKVLLGHFARDVFIYIRKSKHQSIHIKLNKIKRTNSNRSKIMRFPDVKCSIRTCYIALIMLIMSEIINLLIMSARLGVPATSSLMRSQDMQIRKTVWGGP